MTNTTNIPAKLPEISEEIKSLLSAGEFEHLTFIELALCQALAQQQARRAREDLQNFLGEVSK